MTDELIETTADETAVETPQEDPQGLKPKMKLKGTVKRLELYGAFLDLGLANEALIHISQLGKERVNRVSDVLKVGDEIEVWVERIDPARQQVMVTMIEPLAVEWSDLKNEQVYTGRVSRLENFGAFINIGAEREGLVHISELSHDYVKHPSEVLKIDQEVEVKVLSFNKRKRRIDLSMKALMEKPEPEVRTVQQNESSNSRHNNNKVTAVEYEPEEEVEEMPTAMEVALRRAMSSNDTFSFKRESKKERDRKRAKIRSQQEDIISRTLQMEHGN